MITLSGFVREYENGKVEWHLDGRGQTTPLEQHSLQICIEAMSKALADDAKKRGHHKSGGLIKMVNRKPKP